MSLLQVLREARSTRVAVLQQFLAQYDPKRRSVYAFVEGHEDEIFVRRILIGRTSPDTYVYTYRCEGKHKVYQTFEAIAERHPSAKTILFFVDKDLDDVLGTPWPTDPRIFVTDVYSVENYLVSVEVLEALFRDAVRLRGVEFDVAPLLAVFEREWSRFCRTMIPVMAWIVMVRRAGGKPNLGSLELRDLVSVSPDCACSSRRRRMEVLARITGVQPPAGAPQRLLETSRELRRLDAARIVRGKWSAAFFVMFWKEMLERIRHSAAEGGGAVNCSLALEKGNFVATLAPLAGEPRALARFLDQHMSDQAADRSSPAGPRESLLGRIRQMFRG